METNKFYNMDCLEFMQTLPDKSVDLVLTDPPYGLDIAKTGSLGNDKFTPKEWDNKIPEDIYFDEIQRVSKNQIIFGGNYFPYLWKEPCKGFIFWNKLNHHNNRADGEMAWTSFNKLAKYYEYMWDGNRYGFKTNIMGVGMPTIRQHPTEKPIALFEMILKDYSNENDIILDCFSGSGTTAIACHNLNRKFICIEKDKEYYEKSVIRYEKHIQQTKLF